MSERSAEWTAGLSEVRSHLTVSPSSERSPQRRIFCGAIKNKCHMELKLIHHKSLTNQSICNANAVPSPASFLLKISLSAAKKGGFRSRLEVSDAGTEETIQILLLWEKKGIWFISKSPHVHLESIDNLSLSTKHNWKEHPDGEIVAWLNWTLTADGRVVASILLLSCLPPCCCSLKAPFPRNVVPVG